MFRRVWATRPHDSLLVGVVLYFEFVSALGLRVADATVGGEFNLDPRRSPHRHLEQGTQACNRVWFMSSQVDLAGVIVAAIRMTTRGVFSPNPHS